MPKPLGFFHPDFVGDFTEVPWWLRVLIIVLLCTVLGIGIYTTI